MELLTSDLGPPADYGLFLPAGEGQAGHWLGAHHCLADYMEGVSWDALFGIEGGLKFRRKRMTDLISDEALCRTAQATPALLKI